MNEFTLDGNFSKSYGLGKWCNASVYLSVIGRLMVLASSVPFTFIVAGKLVCVAPYFKITLVF